MTAARPDWPEYFLGIAKAVSARADCTRRKVGALIVHNGRIVSSGYNGSPPGAVSCLDGLCPRGRLSTEELAPGTPYGSCIAIHAERNAILYAPPEKLVGSTMYVWGGQPCTWCQEYIDAVGIDNVVWHDEQYPTPGSLLEALTEPPIKYVTVDGEQVPMAGQPGAHTDPYRPSCECGRAGCGVPQADEW